MKIYLNMLKSSPPISNKTSILKNLVTMNCWILGGGRFPATGCEVEGKIEHSGKDIHAQGKVQTVVELTVHVVIKPVTYSIDSSFFAAVVDENCQKDLAEPKKM